MPAPFQTLLTAILADDRDRVKTLLARDPALGRERVTKEQYVPAIVHWIYAGDTALHVAAAGYRMEIARLLLAAGADPAAAANRRASQPIHYAADGHVESSAWHPRRQVALLRLLLQAGAPIDAPDKNGATPLHRAVRTRCADALQCLLAAGADATLRNAPGSTAFHLAVQNTGRGGSGSAHARDAQRDIIAAFLAHHISPGLTDVHGKTVRQWARSEWIQELLTQAP